MPGSLYRTEEYSPKVDDHGAIGTENYRWHEIHVVNLYATNILDNQNTYVLDYTVADHGVATGQGNRSLKDFLDSIGTSKFAVIKVSHVSSGTSDSFLIDTSIDLSSYPNIFFLIEGGALFDGVTGDETLTLYSPENIIASPRQQIFGSDITVAFANESPHSIFWYGITADGSADDTSAIEKADGNGGAIFLQGNYGVSDLDLTEPPIFDGEVTFTVLSGASYGVKFTADGWSSPQTIRGGFYVDMTGLSAAATAVVISTRAWYFPYINITGQGAAYASIGVDFQGTTTHPITHNHIGFLKARLCRYPIQIAPGTHATNGYASNNKISGALLTTGDNTGTYNTELFRMYHTNTSVNPSIFHNDFSFYGETADFGIAFISENGTSSPGIGSNWIVATLDAVNTARLYIDRHTPTSTILLRNYLDLYSDQQLDNSASDEGIVQLQQIGRIDSPTLRALTLYNPQSGVPGVMIQMEAGATNWSRGFLYKDADGNTQGGYGVFGAANDDLDYLWIGTAYNDWGIKVDTVNSQVILGWQQGEALQLLQGATPDISGGNKFRMTQAGATNVTDFTNPIDGQEITILFGDGNSTLKHAGGTLELNGAADWNPASGDTIRLIYFSTNTCWYEVSRSDNT